MDVPEPEQTPFTAVTAQTSKLARVSQLHSPWIGLQRLFRLVPQKRKEEKENASD
jgi:hypothetical protein